jgi:hypothetical protein
VRVGLSLLVAVQEKEKPQLDGGGVLEHPGGQLVFQAIKTTGLTRAMLCKVKMGSRRENSGAEPERTHWPGSWTP